MIRSKARRWSSSERQQASTPDPPRRRSSSERQPASRELVSRSRDRVTGPRYASDFVVRSSNNGARRIRRPLAALALAAAFTGLTFGGAVAPAQAVGSGAVTVTVTGDPAKVGVADTAGPTKLTVTGSGFQSIEGGFGGIYVLFGWNAGPGWEPSAGGSSGSAYRYVADDPNAPAGYQLFVPFPGSSTQAEGNGGSLNADGTWSAELTIAGPTFTPVDADGTGETIDCTQVQCGIMTIGAHGVVNPANESFTPITFEDFSAPTPTPTPEPTAEAQPTDEPTMTATATDDVAAESGDATPWIVWGIVVVVLVGGGALAIVLMRRRRTAHPPTE